MCFTDCVRDFTAREVKESEVRTDIPQPMSSRLSKIDKLFSFVGEMLFELHGKIFENESENFPKIPRVPNDSK